MLSYKIKEKSDRTTIFLYIHQRVGKLKRVGEQVDQEFVICARAWAARGLRNLKYVCEMWRNRITSLTYVARLDHRVYDFEISVCARLGAGWSGF